MSLINHRNGGPAVVTATEMTPATHGRSRKMWTHQPVGGGSFSLKGEDEQSSALGGGQNECHRWDRRWGGAGLMFHFLAAHYVEGIPTSAPN